MLSPGDTVGIGLSGGADSVCLTHFLVKNKEKLNIKKLVAIHIHHGIRGDEADRDMEFCRSFCEKIGVDFISFKADVPAEAEKTGESLEECARRIRYEFFEKCPCNKIATAHNLNDSMETFLFNLVRGSSLAGLCSIPYKREGYIRPLLDVSRDEIEEYIRENNLSYVTDSTNLCDDYTRNKIRHNVLPQLFEINPSFGNTFKKCRKALIESSSFINESAQEYVDSVRNGNSYDFIGISNRHPAVRNQAVSLVLKEQRIPNLSREYIDSVLNIIENDGIANLGGKITANSSRGVLTFGEIKPTEPFEMPVSTDTQKIKTPVGEYAFTVKLLKDLQNLNKQDMDNLMDCDKISLGAVLRNRRDGDRYRLHSRPTKTLKGLFNEKKIPVTRRDKMLIFSDNDGIVWTEYFGVCERCRIDENTKRVLKIEKVGEE